MSKKSREKLEEKMKSFKSGFQPEVFYQAQLERVHELRRIQRLNHGLNRAICLGDAGRICHWQKMVIKYYEIPIE